MRIDGVTSLSTIQNTQDTHPIDAKNTNVDDNNMTQNISEGISVVNDNMQEKEVNEDELTKAVETVNKSVKPYDRKLDISIHKETGEVMVKVIDTSGNEDKIIREIPPKKVLDRVAKMLQLAGIILDERI